MGRVLISGANQGIGFYIAKQLLTDGNIVAVLDIETDGLIKLAEEYPERLFIFKCDVSSAEETNAAVAEAAKILNGIDCAVHNACKCTFAAMENTTDETYRSVFDVNYFGALNIARAAVPVMKKQGRGRIIFTSSGVGIMGFVNISPYASSKAAIESLAKCLNIEYQGSGITFHIFHPPLTKTKSSAPLPVPQEFMADPEKVGTGLAKRMFKNKFIICHSFGQSIQTKMAYLFPLAMGKLLSKMTAKSAEAK
jgi:NAD(P)-dependent dehydrogenase (short-subunit alcohol dehydrogenase family)